MPPKRLSSAMAAGKTTPGNSPKPKRGKKNDGVAVTPHSHEVDEYEHDEIEVVPEAVAITKSSLRSAASRAGPEVGSVTTASPTPEVTSPENTGNVLIVSLKITPDALMNMMNRRTSSPTVGETPASAPQAVVAHSWRRRPNYGRKSVGPSVPAKINKSSYLRKAQSETREYNPDKLPSCIHSVHDCVSVVRSIESC